MREYLAQRCSYLHPNYKTLHIRHIADEFINIRKIVFRVIENKTSLSYNRHMISEQEFLQNLYTAFNNREIETLIALMKPDVKWANGMQGGFVYGRDAVREYWEKQFELLKSHLEPLSFELDEAGRAVVTNQLVVSDLEDNILLDKKVKHLFTIENGLIKSFEIGDSEPLLENEDLHAVSEEFSHKMSAKNDDNKAG